MSFLRRIKAYGVRVWRNITIEPVVAFYLTAIGLNEVIRPNLLLDKSCLFVHNFTQEICNDINEDAYKDELEIVQGTVSDYERTLSLAAFFPRILYCLVAGAWSDRHGRKFLIAMPIFGQFLVNVTYLINYAFIETLPFEMLYLEFINELCGSFVVYYLAVYSYMADITTEVERSSRISVLDGTDYIFTMVGTSISGAIFQYVGYYTIFGMSASLACFGVLYVTFVVKESLGQRRGREEEKCPDPMNNLEQDRREDDGLRGEDVQVAYGSMDQLWVDIATGESSNCCVRNFPHPKDVLAGFITVLKRREGKTRMMILMLIFNFACYIFAYNGTEGTHRYFYAQYKYGWDERQYTFYLSLYRIFYLITLWLLLPVASRFFGLHDATIAIIACLTGALGMIIPAVSTPAYAFYIGSIVSSFSPAATITVRAMASRCVNEDEVGKLFAVISLMSAVSSSLISAAYQSIYSATLDTFAGAFLLVNAGFFLITVPNNLYLRKKLR